MRQGLRAGTSRALCCLKDERVLHIFGRVLEDSNWSMVFVSKASYVQKILEARVCKSPMVLEMSRPSSFKLELYYHSLLFLEECM